LLDEPDFAALHQISSPPTGLPSSHSCSSWSRGALGEQLVQGVSASLLRLHDEAAALNRYANLGTRLQVQNIEQRGWDGQDNRAADLAQIGSVHGDPTLVIF
jgi:hypothetical protein